MFEVESEIEGTEGHETPFEASDGETSTSHEDESGDDDGGEWKPNLTYRRDKEEIAFDEWLQPVVTSPEIENQIRELYTRANGFDSYKSRLEESQRKIDNLALESQRLKDESEYARYENDDQDQHRIDRIGILPGKEANRHGNDGGRYQHQDQG